MQLPIGTERGENDWAVILAGGDGTRLKALTRRISGDDRPKQFCRILGHETLLKQTRAGFGRNPKLCSPGRFSGRVVCGTAL